MEKCTTIFMHSDIDMSLLSDLKDWQIQCLDAFFGKFVADCAESDGYDCLKPKVQIKLRIPESIPYDEYSKFDGWILL